MAISFENTAGQAKKGKINWYKFKDGNNEFRIVGDILPMYVYWGKNTQGQNLPVECLAFDRDQERFTNEERDVFLEYFPLNEKGEDNKPSWAYCCQAINEAGELCVVQLKKKLFTEQIQTAAETLGDPTDPVTGWKIRVKRKKTGSLAWNVTYTLDSLKLVKEPLTPEELELIEDMKPIDEIIPRPTPEKQETFIKNYFIPKDEEDDIPDDVADDLPG